ncbi:MAG: radical SAM protein [Clostridia bacterium]|nr:radical SAM protein [Clostridia bacterium]
MNKALIKNIKLGTKYTAPIIGIERLRIGSDGKGVSTLVGFWGCTLRCEYCLNPQCFDESAGTEYSVRQLYETVQQDDLYFISSGGGITFGGGEPLLYTDFIWAFCKLAPKQWHICAETSLCVKKENIIKAVGCIDTFYVDIKDTNPDIYKRYTKMDNTQVLENLSLLLSLVSNERVIVRVPYIEGYNTNSDREKSIELLKKIGVSHLDLFDYDIHARTRKENKI